jgi:dynein heavy chain 1
MGHVDSVVDAMIEFYQFSRKNTAVDKYSHYVYSPRELTRWVRGISQATKGLETISVSQFVKIFVYEAQRLFSDRLVSENERQSNTTALEGIVGKYFNTFDASEIFNCPPVHDMRNFIKEKLDIFCNEEMDTKLILFDDAAEHILRLDRTFR